jgi:hypothetical protein
MITLGDLKTRSKFRLVMAIDMAKGQYQNTYLSETYPRLMVVKSGGPHALARTYDTTYYVDGEECADLEAVLAMLNTTPHPARENVARHQRDLRDIQDDT